MAWLQTQPHWWRMALAQGLVSGDAAGLVDEHEPGTLLIGLSMLGALVCLVPLAAFFALALGESFLVGIGGWVTGVVALMAGGALLRSSPQPFLNCVAMVLWGAGVSLLVAQVMDAISNRFALMVVFGCIAGAMAVAAWLSRTRWIAAVMGVVWSVAISGMLLTLESYAPVLMPLQLGSFLLAFAWWWWLRTEPGRLTQQEKWWGQPRWAAFADAAVLGVLAAALWGGRRWWSAYMWDDVDLGSDWTDALRIGLWVSRGFAVLMVGVATALLVRGWKARQLASARLYAMVWLAGGLLAVGAWFSVGLAVVVVVAAAALLGARWRIAALCAVLALYLLGRFYYDLGWPLVVKGWGLVSLGAALILGLWLLQRGAAVGRAKASVGATDSPSPRTALAWILAGAVLVFGLVNWDVLGKEQVIAHGQRILVPLVPVDPRSLMQGDYMALNFELPPKVSAGLEEVLAPTQRVRATVDARGVARVQALVDERVALAAGDVVLPLKRLKGRWVLVTDAYFFPEGQGHHFALAQFGDFRVLPDGRALLVGLADADGAPMQAPAAAAP